MFFIVSSLGGDYIKSRIPLIVIITAFIVLFGSGFSAYAQEPEITSLRNSTGVPGALVSLDGSGFLEPSSGRSRSVVLVGSPPNQQVVDTVYVNSEQLFFVIPIETPCGQSAIAVRNSPTPGGESVLSSEQSYEVSCGGQTPPPVQIEELSTTSAPPGEQMTLTGMGFVLPTSTTQHSLVRFGDTEINTDFLMDSLQFDSASGQWRAQLQFTIPQDAPCGPTNITVTKRYSGGGQIYESTIADFNVTDPCEPETGNGDGSEPPEAQGGYEVVSLDLPSTAQINEPISGTVNIVHPSEQGSTPAQMRIFIDDELVGSQPLQGLLEQTVEYPLSLRFPAAGRFSIRVEAGDSSMSAEIQISSSGEGGGNGEEPPEPPEEPPQDEPPEDPVPEPPPEEPEPPETPEPPEEANVDLSELDQNENCVIDEIEFFTAVDTWISGNLADESFFVAIDAWINESDICNTTEQSSTKNLFAVHLGSTGLRISATDAANVSSMRAYIYNLDGELVRSVRSASSELMWHLRNERGQRVANGVYFYRVEVRESIGKIKQSELRKLVVIR